MNIAVFVAALALDLTVGMIGSRLHSHKVTPPSEVVSDSEQALSILNYPGDRPVLIRFGELREKHWAETTWLPMTFEYQTTFDPDLLIKKREFIQLIAAHEACHVVLHPQVVKGILPQGKKVEDEADDCGERIVNRMRAKRREK